MSRAVSLLAWSFLVVGCHSSHDPTDPLPDVRLDSGLDAAPTVVPMADAGRRCSPDPAHREPHQHHYSCIEDAWRDGLAVYLPFSARNLREEVILDEGRYFPALRYPFDGAWSAIDGDTGERWGAVVRAEPPSEIGLRFPLTPGASFTMMVVFAAIGADASNAAFSWASGDEASCPFSVVIDTDGRCDRSGHCLRVATRCGATSSESPLRLEPTPSGAVVVFLTWHDAELELRSGRERVTLAAPGAINIPPAAQTRLSLGSLLSLAVWDRILDAETMQRLTELDSEITDGF